MKIVSCFLQAILSIQIELTTLALEINPRSFLEIAEFFGVTLEHLVNSSESYNGQGKLGEHLVLGQDNDKAELEMRAQPKKTQKIPLTQAEEK